MAPYRGPDRRLESAAVERHAAWGFVGVVSTLGIGLVTITHASLNHGGIDHRLTNDLWLLTLVLATLFAIAAHRLWRTSGLLRVSRMVSVGALLALAATVETMTEVATPIGLAGVLSGAAALVMIQSARDPDVDAAVRQPRDAVVLALCAVGGWTLLRPFVFVHQAGTADRVTLTVSAALWGLGALAVWRRARQGERASLGWIPVFAAMVAAAQLLHVFSYGEHTALGLVAAAGTTSAVIMGAVGVVAGLTDSAVGRRRDVKVALERAARQDRERTRRDHERSHEVENALLAIEGGVAALTRNHDLLSDDVHRPLVGSLARELHVVRSLLEEGIPEHGEPDGGIFDVAAVVREQAVLARARGQLVGLETSGVSLACGDPLVTGRIVANLLLNVERHAGGEAEVRVDEGAGAVRVIVRDHGPGIPLSGAERILDVEANLHEADSRSGLGLRIASREARAMGGDLSLCPGGPGACFVLTLPTVGVLPIVTPTDRVGDRTS